MSSSLIIHVILMFGLNFRRLTIFTCSNALSCCYVISRLDVHINVWLNKHIQWSGWWVHSTHFTLFHSLHTNLFLYILVDWPSHPAVTGSWHTLWERWCRSLCHLRFHLETQKKSDPIIIHSENMKEQPQTKVAPIKKWTLKKENQLLCLFGCSFTEPYSGHRSP